MAEETAKDDAVAETKTPAVDTTDTDDAVVIAAGATVKSTQQDGSPEDSGDSEMLDSKNQSVVTDASKAEGLDGLAVESSAVFTSNGGTAGPSSTEQKLAMMERRVSVTIDRKNVLLLKARESRNEWVQQVPTPYAEAVDQDDPWQHDDRLKTLQSIHAAKKLPSTMTLLAQLYRLDDMRPAKDRKALTEVADRIHNLMGSAIEYDERAVPSATDKIKEALAENDQDTSLIEYHTFWKQLQDPTCAMLVQGMRNFCRKLTRLKTKDELSTTINSYLRSTFHSLQSHSVWKKNGADEKVRRAMEAFIYGQCYKHLESVMWNNDTQTKDDEWAERISSLEFISPQHLEIECLLDESLNVEELLKDAVSALLSVDRYFSAYDKLQRVLAVYHGVNTALSKALNHNQQDGSKRKLPSADDVLPAIILTVIRAKPDRLHFNLDFIEQFSTPEYLRGEAGYAFTNLYGAVQFLQDLDFDEPKSLSISAEEFREKLNASRASSKMLQESMITKEDSDIAVQLSSPNTPRDSATMAIPPVEIRKARERGEVIDLNWALKWHKENSVEFAQQSGNEGESISAEIGGVEEGWRRERANTDELTTASTGGAEVSLPPGFSRSYSFLTARPEDIRMADLPKLLSEYRMLVHATETLIGEKAAQAAAERKSKQQSFQKELYDRVRFIDPSLLPVESNGKK